MQRGALLMVVGGAMAAITASSFVAAQPSDVGDLLRKTQAAAPKVDKPAPKAAANAPAEPSAPSEAPMTNSVAKVEPAAPAKPAAPAVPERRPRYPVAILQALDKVTAESMRFEAPVGQPIRYRNLVFTVKSCESTTKDERPEDAIAFVEVESQAAGGAHAPVRNVFKGWMFADSPSVNPLQHPVYDAWLIACKA